MKKLLFTMLLFTLTSISAMAQEQLKKVYDENIDRMEQIDNALAKANKEGKFVICQVGGNWCPWCLRFADLVSKDADLAKIISDNYVYTHVNLSRKTKGTKDDGAVKKRLGNPARFGLPVFVIHNSDGSVLHIQDSSYLEEGQGYSKEKIAGFLKNWTPSAVAITEE